MVLGIDGILLGFADAHTRERSRDAMSPSSIQRAVELEPGNPESIGMAAFSAVYLGRFDKALALSRRAVDLDPLNAGSWEALGETEFLMGHSDQAVGDLKKAIELNPDLWNGHIFLSKSIYQSRTDSRRVTRNRASTS